MDEAEQANKLEALVSNFLENRTYSREHARAALVNREGITRIEGDQRREVSPPVIVVVTNARVIFVTQDDDLDLDEGLLDYGDLADIAVDEGESNLIELTTDEGVVWECVLPEADPDVLTAVKNHLRWIGGLRRQTTALEAEVESAADTVCEYANQREWEAARGAYDRVRDRLDRFISALQITNTVADHVLAPELTDIERTLEEGHVRMYIEQARSQLEVTRTLIEREEYGSARTALQEARDIHQTAKDQSEAVRRGDSFQFGRQRDIEDDLQRLDWEFESVAAEPVRQANDAVVRAGETDDVATAIEHRKVALDRYDSMLEVGWLDIESDASDDTDDIREKRAETVQRLVDLHAEIASERWNQAVYRQRAGDVGAALERMRTTVTHVERAHELTEAFERGHIDLSAKLDWMPEALDENPYATRRRASRTKRASSDRGTETEESETTPDEAADDGEEPALDDEIPSLNDDEIPVIDDQGDDGDSQQGATGHESVESDGDTDIQLSVGNGQTEEQSGSTDGETASADGETADEERNRESGADSPMAQVTEKLTDAGGSDSLTWLERGEADESTDDRQSEDQSRGEQSGDGVRPGSSAVRESAGDDSAEVTANLEELNVPEGQTDQQPPGGSPEIPEAVDPERD